MFNDICSHTMSEFDFMLILFFAKNAQLRVARTNL